MAEQKTSKYYISSPTEDGKEQSTSLSSSSVSSTTLQPDLQWPEFADIKGVLDFKSDTIKEERMIALITYILRGNISSINAANVDYLLKLFYSNECKLQVARREKRDISEPKIMELLDNRKYMREELLKELSLQK